ncbi:MAG: hypothetical protein KatS3mg051_1275 [Anaerolineae bacterium]|nr:MAG: hypothetical protein KatS3mg051_1275 [Anaerolineae bacterium]
MTQDKTLRSYTVPDANALSYGTYYWRVAAQDAAGTWSDWSATWRLTITILQAPANAQHTLDTTPTFQWSKPSGAILHQLQVDDAPDFGSPVINETLTTNKFTPLNPLSYGQYWWRVRVDTGAGWGGWTPAWTVIIAPKAPVAPVLLSPLNGACWTSPSQPSPGRLCQTGARSAIRSRSTTPAAFTSPCRM